MKRSKTFRSLAALTLAVAAVLVAPGAMARDGHRGHGNNHGDYRSDYRDNDRGDYRGGYRGDRDDRDDRYDRDDDRRYSRNRVVYVAPRYVAPRYVAPRYGHGSRDYDYQNWSRGVRYDTRGYAPTYVVNDYYGYGLRQPPRGYHWRRDDRGDFLLVAIATGIIAEVLLH